MERIFPYEAKLNKVLGILRILHGRKGSIGIRELSRISRLNHDALIPPVSAAELIGAIRIEDNTIMLTELGNGLNEKNKEAFARVRARLKEMEPFKSAAELAKRREYFSIDDLEKELNKSGIMLHSNPLRSRVLLTEVLVQWAIYFNLLYYDGAKRLWLRTNA